MDINIKKTARILAVHFICFILYFPCFGQGWQKLPVSFSGKIYGSPLNKPDSIQVYFNEGYLLFGTDKFMIPVDKNGEFQFVLKPISNPANLRIGIKNYPSILINRVIEPGDTTYIEANISSEIPGVKFSGNNVRKYDCLDTLQMVFDAFVQSNANMAKDFNRVVDYKDYYQHRHRIGLSAYNEVLSVIDHFGGEISANTKQYISGTYKYLIQGQWDLQMKFDFGRFKQDSLKREIVNIYNFYQFPDYDIDKSIISTNSYYIQYILSKIRTELFLKSFGTGFSYKSFYLLLKERYTGIVRERLLTHFLYDQASTLNVSGFNPKEYEYCLNDAIMLIKDKYLRQKISEKFTLKKGADAYKFSMPDVNGNVVSLNDFKGKVVLLDFWFTGCSGCATFYRMFHDEIYPKLKSELNFRIISVNIDESKKSWLKGINSGKYTSIKNTNLSTGGLNHPLTKFYNTVAFPYILLIDKNGKIYSKIDIGLAPDEILKLIKSALTEKI